MKYTQYFLHTRERTDRKSIEVSWIKRTVDGPDKESVQKDGRIWRWKKIPEAGDKVLRVVLLEDRETVHNAFFDRSYKENDK